MTISLRYYASFAGPNIWNRAPVVHAIVEFDPVTPEPNAFPDLAGIYATLAELPHEGTTLEPETAPKLLDPGEALARMALNLQRIAGIPVTDYVGRRRSVDAGYDVVVEHQHAQIGRYAIGLAVRWLTHLLENDPADFDLAVEFDRFLGLIESIDHGVMGRAISYAARQRGIPQSTVDPSGRIVEFGTGRYRQRVLGQFTSRNTTISSQIARDKHLTNHYLREAGLPVPDSQLVRSLPQAIAAARAIGYPVVIKPNNGMDAYGVVLELPDDDAMRAAFDDVVAAASNGGGTVVVERFVKGNDYRATVVNDTVTGVQQRLHPQVTGDGTHTIRQLIEIENANPRRGIRASSVYKKIPVDDRVRQHLAKSGLTLDDVPLPGQEIVVNKSGHRRDGAIHIDVTDSVHSANLELLRTSTRVLGLDIAGVDVVTPDIGQPIRETGGAIIELNESPAFNLQLFPGAGASRDPGPAIMGMLFPPGQPVRVPVAAVMSGDGSLQLCEQIAKTAAEQGRVVGQATRAGVIIDGVPYRGVDGRNPFGPHAVLNNPNVDFAVVEVDAESIVTHGLGFDVCDLVVLPSLSGRLRPTGEPVETVLLDALAKNGTAMLTIADPATRTLAERRGSNILNIEIDRATGHLAPPLIAEAVAATLDAATFS